MLFKADFYLTLAVNNACEDICFVCHVLYVLNFITN